MIWFDDHLDFVRDYDRIVEALPTMVACRPFYDRVWFQYERKLWLAHGTHGWPGGWQSFDYYAEEPFYLVRLEVIEGGRCGAMELITAATPGSTGGPWYSLCRRGGFAIREHEWIMKLKRSSPFGYR